MGLRTFWGLFRLSGVWGVLGFRISGAGFSRRVFRV